MVFIDTVVVYCADCKALVAESLVSCFGIRFERIDYFLSNFFDGFSFSVKIPRSLIVILK